MDEIRSHHFQTMGNQLLLVFTRQPKRKLRLHCGPQARVKIARPRQGGHRELGRAQVKEQPMQQPPSKVSSIHQASMKVPFAGCVGSIVKRHGGETKETMNIDSGLKSIDRRVLPSVGTPFKLRQAELVFVHVSGICLGKR